MTLTQGVDLHEGARSAWNPPATLPGRDYHAADVWELERTRLFHGGWFCVGRSDELDQPGAYRVVDVAGESVILLRDEKLELHAFLNLCRHRGSRLCDGEGRVRKVLRCPYHAWSYGLDGRLGATPNVAAGERLERERLGLIPVRLAVWEGFTWVTLRDEMPSLDVHLARWASDDPFQWSRYGVGRLVEGARRQYDVAANWKIIVENYNECLHCPTVHPELVQLVPLYRRGEVEHAPGTGDSGNRLADTLTSFTKSGRSHLPPLPNLTPEDMGTFYGVTLLPNLIVNYHSDTVSTFLLLPQAVDRTRVVCHYLFAPGTVAASDFDPAELVDFRDLLAQQDWAVCERAQLGAGSRGFAAGGVLPYADRFVHDFHCRYLAMRTEAA
jgi:Rieske 2Fe-2S family protein